MNFVVFSVQASLVAKLQENFFVRGLLVFEFAILFERYHFVEVGFVLIETIAVDRNDLVKSFSSTGTPRQTF